MSFESEWEQQQIAAHPEQYGPTPAIGEVWRLETTLNPYGYEEFVIVSLMPFGVRVLPLLPVPGGGVREAPPEAEAIMHRIMWGWQTRQGHLRRVRAAM